MLKPLLVLFGGLLLAACNPATMSHSVSKFYSMDRVAFSELMTRYGPGTSEGYGLKAGEAKFYGPKIGYFLYTDGRLSAEKSANGEVKYSFIAALSYQEEFLRKYDTVTDVSGAKLPFKTNSAFQDNGGYMKEFIEVSFTKEQLEEAQYDGLFLTIAAKEHERTVSQRRRGNSSFDLNAALRLANEANGGSNSEYKNNDNFDLTVPSDYISNFMEYVKNN